MLYVPLYRHQLNARVYKNVSWLFNLWLALFIAHIRCIFDSCVLFFCTTPTHTTTTTETARTIHPPSDHCSPLITIVLVRTTLCGYLSHHLRRHAISIASALLSYCQEHRRGNRNVRRFRCRIFSKSWRHWKLIPYRPSSNPVSAQCVFHIIIHVAKVCLLLWPSVFGSFDLLRKEEGTAEAEELTVPNGHKSAPTNDLSYWQSFRLINALSSIARLRYKSPSSFWTMKIPRYDNQKRCWAFYHSVLLLWYTYAYFISWIVFANYGNLSFTSTLCVDWFGCLFH